jgi:ligand-binding SRPBCC domain-containing protein
MPVIELATLILAPAERVFDLARSVDLHLASTAGSGERAVAGVTSGLLGLGDEVTWIARHFGVRWRLTSQITAFERPRHFRDSMVRGIFHRFDHDHFFEATGAGGSQTRMTDRFDFTSPLGPLGVLADGWLLERHMRSLLMQRSKAIRETAESGRWAAYLGN